MTKDETKKFFDTAAKKCVTGQNGLMGLLNEKAQEIQKTDMMGVVTALIEEYKNTKANGMLKINNTAGDFGLWINIKINA